MGPGATYAVMTFCVGVLLLLGWLYATTGNPRSGTMLRKSLLLFAAPMLLAPAHLFHFPLGMLALVASEEGLKVFASTREQARLNKFWLVTLFGVLELTLIKPLWGVALARTGSDWDRLSMAAIIYATALPVLMHAVTAAIYAFAFERRLWAAFLASWAVHTAFNLAIAYFGLSPVAVMIETAILAVTLIGLISRQRMSPASDER